MICASRLVVLLALGLQGGCLSYYQPVDGQPHADRLGANGPVYLAFPHSPPAAHLRFRGDTSARDASAFLMSTLAEEIGRHVGSVVRGEQPESHEEAIASAKAAGAGYAVRVQVRRWAAGQNTIISSRPNESLVRLLIYDTEDGALLDVTDLKSQEDLSLGVGDNRVLFQQAVAAFATDRFGPAREGGRP